MSNISLLIVIIVLYKTIYSKRTIIVHVLILILKSVYPGYKRAYLITSERDHSAEEEAANNPQIHVKNKVNKVPS